MNAITATWSDDWDSVTPPETTKPRPTWRLNVRPVLEDILFWENIDLIEGVENDPAVIPGQVISLATMERERTRGTLNRMIHRFALDGFSWPTGEPVRVSPITAKAANRLLALLPDNIELPKVAPDEGSEVIFAWESGGRTDILIVDGWQLHIVADAGTRQARYYDDIQFDGETLPVAVIQELSG